MKLIMSYLPTEILQLGMSLEEIGIKEIAWDYTTVIKVIGIIQEEQCFVLGVDVYKTIGNKVESTYDSWYANKNEMTIEESLGKAKKFIEDYQQKRGEEYLYTLIIG